MFSLVLGKTFLDVISIKKLSLRTSKFLSKHLSVGTFAVTSLMVYSTVSRIESEYPELIKLNETG